MGMSTGEIRAVVNLEQRKLRSRAWNISTVTLGSRFGQRRLRGLTKNGNPALPSHRNKWHFCKICMHNHLCNRSNRKALSVYPCLDLHASRLIILRRTSRKVHRLANLRVALYQIAGELKNMAASTARPALFKTMP